MNAQGRAGARIGGDGRTLLLSGSWRLHAVGEITNALDTLPKSEGRISTLDGSSLTEIDTASGALLLRYLSPKDGDASTIKLSGFSESHANIMKLVLESYKPPLPLRAKHAPGIIGAVGEASMNIADLLIKLTSFIGETCVELWRTILHPRRLRFKEFVAQLELVALDAIPIVCLVTFLIGIVIAYLFGIQIEKYGANIFIVDGVGLAICRELSPILVAIILAGRSGSAFTAQIGTMKLNEEVDAMQTLGLSPMQVLVVPRVLALMVAMPLLVFVGDAVGLIGSMVIADLRLGITGVTFLERLHVVLPVRSFMVGMIKAPVFAAFIAVIGCQLGLSVENNARSVGQNTTSTVVRSIVAVILLNAAFAIIFQELKI